MSEDRKGLDDTRRALLGEFSKSVERDFTRVEDRDFEDTAKAQIAMADQQRFEENGLAQRLEAELDGLKHSPKNVPRYSLSQASSTSNKDRYEDVMGRYEDGLDIVSMKFADTRDQIRDYGVTLSDVFTDDAGLLISDDDDQLNLEELGIDTQYSSDGSSDADYYGHDGHDVFHDMRDPFVNSYGADDADEFGCAADDEGYHCDSDHDNSGGRSR